MTEEQLNQVFGSAVSVVLVFALWSLTVLLGRPRPVSPIAAAWIAALDGLKPCIWNITYGSNRRLEAKGTKGARLVIGISTGDVWGRAYFDEMFAVDGEGVIVHTLSQLTRRDKRRLMRAYFNAVARVLAARAAVDAEHARATIVEIRDAKAK